MSFLCGPVTEKPFLLLHLSSPIYFSRTSSGFIDFMISTKNDCLPSEFLSMLSGPLECNLPSRFLDLAECADNLPTPLPPTSAAPVWFNGLLPWPQLDFYHHPELLRLRDLKFQCPQGDHRCFSHSCFRDLCSMRLSRSPIFSSLSLRSSKPHGPCQPHRSFHKLTSPLALTPLQLYKTQFWVSLPLSLPGSFSPSGLRRGAKWLRVPTGIIRVAILAPLHNHCVTLSKFYKFLVCRFLICKREK